MNDCLFCNITKNGVIKENDSAFAIYDGYPVTELHTLVIPKRHVKDYFDLLDHEREDCHLLLIEMKAEIEFRDQKVDGFNVGINIGKSSGQTIFHCHIHLIPRREGDIDNPRGGVRGVIPEKRIY
jgi:ATP adenylyltransferase